MIVRTVKPKFAARCNVCNSQHMIEGEPDKDGSPSLEMREQASKLGFTLVMIHFQTPTNIERGQHSLYFCPVCVRALISAMTFSDKEAVAIWETVSASFPDKVRELWRQPAIMDAEKPIENLVPVALKEPFAAPIITERKKVQTRSPESSVGLPANTCSQLQNTAERFNITVTDEMSAALKRLYSQKGTVEDLGLWRAVAESPAANIDLPSEAQLRGFDEVNEELRKNA